MSRTDLVLTGAMWVLGLLSAGDLSEAAQRALETGFDTNSLRILAALPKAEYAEAPDLFVRCLHELDLEPLTRADAARKIANAVSKRILSGEETPRAAAEHLWDVSIRVGDPRFHDLDPFIYAASEMRSRPQDADFFNREIIREAKEWASRTYP
jgi:hypothetical protein